MIFSHLEQSLQVATSGGVKHVRENDADVGVGSASTTTVEENDDAFQPAALLPEIAVSFHPPDDTGVPSGTKGRNRLAQLRQEIVITTSEPVRAGVFKSGHSRQDRNRGKNAFLPYAAFVTVKQDDSKKGRTSHDCYSETTTNGQLFSSTSMIIENALLSPLVKRTNHAFIAAPPEYVLEEENRPHMVILLDVKSSLTDKLRGKGDAIIGRKVALALQLLCNDATRCNVLGRPMFFSGDDSSRGSIRPLSQFSRSSFRLTRESSEAKLPVKPEEDTNPDGNDAGEAGEIGGAAYNDISWTQWMRSSRIDEKQSKNERNTMTFEEVAAALQDVHGSLSSPSGSRNCDEAEGPPVLGKKLKAAMASREKIEQFDEALARFDDDVKEAVMMAQKFCPDQVSDEEKSLFILGQSSENSEVAAMKFCQHWKMRLEVFGFEKAFLPLTVREALKDEADALLNGTDLPGWYLPVAEDKFGRAIFYAFGPKECPSHEDRLSVLRVVWYFMDFCLRNMSDVRNGSVHVLDLTHSRLPDSDLTLVRQLFRLINLWPMEPKAIHHIRLPWFESLVLPVVNYVMGKRLRMRTLNHRGSQADILLGLSRYGLDPSCLPKEVGGDIFLDPNWIRRRESLAESNDTVGGQMAWHQQSRLKVLFEGGRDEI